MNSGEFFNLNLPQINLYLWWPILLSYGHTDSMAHIYYIVFILVRISIAVVKHYYQKAG